jgi:uncharacterized repeat protein (TIGR01451 family)
MLLAAVGLGAVGVVQMSIEPSADAVSLSIGTISAQMSDHEGITEGGESDGTSETNCIRYEPSNTASSSDFVTSPGEALTSHGRTGSTCPANLDVTQQSALAIAPVAGGSITSGEAFLLAEVTLSNKSVEGSGAAYYRGVTSLEFGDFDGDPTADLAWRSWETPDNPKPCPYGGGPGGACRDAVTFTLPGEIAMTKDGQGYRLMIDSVNPVEGEEACPATPAVEVMSEEEEGEPNTITARENASGRGCVYGTVVTGREVTIVKRIEGISTEVVAPSATFTFDSSSSDSESPWNDLSIELTPPDDGSDSSDPKIWESGETLTFVEQDPMNPRWELTGAECTGTTDWAFDSETGELTLGGKKMTLVEEEDGPVTCTFTNTYTPMTTLTLVKEVADGDAEVDDFVLTATPVEGEPISGVTGSEAVTEAKVPAGAYVLSEDGPAGYLSPDGWDCGVFPVVTNTVTVSADADVVCTIVNEVEREEITLAKSASTGYFSAAGQSITYTYTVSNSGNMPLGPGQFKVTDDRIDSGVAFDCGASTVELDPDEAVSCTRSYTTTASDVTASAVTNVAFASLGELDSATVSATVKYAVLLLAKSASPTQVSAAGQSVTYTYTLTNNGSVALGPAQFSVTDNKINGGTAFNCGPAASTIAVAGTLSCTSTYTVTASDITAGSIVNTASASGGGATSPTVSATVTVVSAPPVTPPAIFFPGIVTPPILPAEVTSMKLTKSASPNFYFAKGDVITYTYTLLNDGDKAIGPTQFTVTDNKINGGRAFNCGPANTTLAADAIMSCTATYVVTDLDMFFGGVTNVAFATGGTVDSNTATVTVNAEKLIFPAELPVTGPSTTAPALLALFAVGSGLGLVVLERRRRIA